MSGRDELGQPRDRITLPLPDGPPPPAEPPASTGHAKTPAAGAATQPRDETAAAALLTDAGTDRYQLLELLGQGGTGEVHRARDNLLGREVALKLLRPGTASLEERLLAEARSQARVDHPGICKIFEVGRSAAGRPYLALQLVRGSTLAAAAPGLLREEKVAILRAVAEAVHAAHRAGLVHRDLKPNNVLLERDGRGALIPFVTDFGLARDLTAEGWSGSDAAAGTPAYMAPEQVRGDVAAIDRRTDVYGLGATLFELLSGRPPFEASSALALAARIHLEDPPALRQLDPSIPRDLELVVAQCLAKTPGSRYPSARALADDLGRYLDGEPVSARPFGVLDRVRRFRRTRPALFAGLCVGTALAIGFLAVGAAGLRRARKAQEAAQRFGAQARELDDALRLAYMRPPHDVRGERAEIRKRMAALRAEAERLGPVARPAADLALGRAHLALEEDGRAAELLSRAYADGSRAPALTSALGLALGEQYRRERLEVERLPKSLRPARQADLEKRLRDPALLHLREAAAASAQEAEAGRARLALVESRWDDALREAQVSLIKTPWLYEARLWAGDAELGLAIAARNEGHGELATPRFEAAVRQYEAGADEARSDPRPRERACNAWAELAWSQVWAGSTGSVRDSLAKAEASCAQAAAVGAEGAAVPAALASAYYASSEAALRSGQDPRELTARGLTQAAECEARDPALPRCPELSALLHDGAAMDAVYHARDPLPESRLATQAADRAVAMNGFSTAAGGLTWMHRALFEGRAGLDPRGSSARAIAALSRLPESVSTLSNQGALYNDLANWKASHGVDPLPEFTLARSLFSRVVALEGDFSDHANAGFAALGEASYRAAHGSDPDPSLSQARAEIAVALGKAPGISNLLLMADTVELQQAEADLNRMRPAQTIRRSLAEAERFAGRAAQADPRDPSGSSDRAVAHLIAAKAALVAGRDGGPELAAAAPLLARTLAAAPERQSTQQRAATAELLAGWSAWRRGRDPRPACGRARILLHRARAVDPQLVDLLELGAELELLSARAATRADERGGATARGLTLIREATRLDSARPRLQALQALLTLEQSPGDADSIRALARLRGVPTLAAELAPTAPWSLARPRPEKAGQIR